MRTSSTYRLRLYLLFLWIPIVLIGCPPAVQPSLTFDDEGGDRLTCDGAFGEQINITQKGLLAAQVVQFQAAPAAGASNVNAGVAVDPTQKSLQDDMPETLTLNGQLQNRCQQGTVSATATGATGITATDDFLISPVPVRITTGAPVRDGAAFSYTVTVQCCAGSGDNVELTFSNGASSTLTNIGNLSAPNPTSHSFKCLTDSTQTEQVMITGSLSDPSQPGLTRLIVNDQVNSFSCTTDTTIP